MRKHQQKQISELLGTIREAQDAGLYAQCQDGALIVGEFIESIMGVGTKTVSLLEEYCELVFKASNGTESGQSLDEKLTEVENSVYSELKPGRIEVVFFPYNLTMWDSLESIYLAAKEDPDCDAFVVPLPYTTLGPNRVPEETVYDGDEYPANIPVTHWQDYDVETRCPDAIFIHYPYDEMGANYTVPEEFYSKRLRNFCGCLVYVPYFVSPVSEVEVYNAYLPGVLNAHYVIVQSETVRQSYIKHFNDFEKEADCYGKYGKAEEKFIALGSPKFDKVISTKPEDFELPAEWHRKIFKDDPAGKPHQCELDPQSVEITNKYKFDPDNPKRKKIILYNTHMFAWLSNPEKYFKKLGSVLDTFFNRDDVVLWWRPHPNTAANFKLRHPELLNEYHRIIDIFKTSDCGIYDNTPDLHRAIACTDAYYGDMSSLVALYKATGKPVMVQEL